MCRNRLPRFNVKSWAPPIPINIPHSKLINPRLSSYASITRWHFFSTVHKQRSIIVHWLHAILVPHWRFCLSPGWAARTSTYLNLSSLTYILVLHFWVKVWALRQGSWRLHGRRRDDKSIGPRQQERCQKQEGKVPLPQATTHLRITPTLCYIQYFQSL